MKKSLLLLSLLLILVSLSCTDYKISSGLVLSSEELIVHPPCSVVTGIVELSSNLTTNTVLTVSFYSDKDELIETVSVNETIYYGDRISFSVECSIVAASYSAVPGENTQLMIAGMYESHAKLVGIAQNMSTGVLSESVLIIRFYDADYEPLCDSVAFGPPLGPMETWEFDVACWYGDPVFYDLVDNSPPFVPDVIINDGNATTVDDLHCFATPSKPDLDGDIIGYGYRWFKNGIVYSDLGGNNWVDSSLTTKGDSWSCFVICYDGTDYSESGFDTITIQNALPTTPQAIVLTPQFPAINQALTCTVSPGMDPDGDVINYRYEWYINYADYVSITCISPLLYNIIEPENTDILETWRCEVSSYDGEDYSSAIRSNSVVIGTSDFVEPADANADGKLNSADVTKVERIVAGLD